MTPSDAFTQLRRKRTAPIDDLLPGLLPGPKDNFSRGQGLKGKFLVTYAGSLGSAQGLSTVLEAADLLGEVPEIHCLLVGGGSSEKELLNAARRLALPNVTQLPYHPYSLMPQIYGASALCLFPQAVETGSDAFPSKVYRIMACGRAVLAVTGPGSDLSRLVLEAGCGVRVPPGVPEELAAAIEQLYRAGSRCWEMGQSSRNVVVDTGSRANVTRQYHDLVCDLTRGGPTDARAPS